MKCYIYFIINQETNQRYVGQTTNFSRRKSEHLTKLRENRHPNLKLQNAFNFYGENNFVIEKIKFDNISKTELDEQEKFYIKKYNSYEDGYNLTEGGTGGDTRSKLNFEQYCFLYFGNNKYKGMTNRSSKYIGVDSSCVSALTKGKSYDAFREKALLLSEKEKEEYILKFEKELDIKNNKPWIKQETLDDDTTLKIMCVVSSYGRGIEKTILTHFGLSKGFIFHLMTGNGRLKVKEQYTNLSQEERMSIGEKYFEEWKLQQYSKINIKKIYSDLNTRY